MPQYLRRLNLNLRTGLPAGSRLQFDELETYEERRNTRPLSVPVLIERRYLDIALHVFVAYRNYVRRRFNRDEDSPAAMLGFAPRRLTPGELLSWRQDAARASIHPLARDSESVRQWGIRHALAS